MKYPSLLSNILDSKDVFKNISKMMDQPSSQVEKNGSGTIANVVAEALLKEEKSYVVSDSLMDALDTVDCEEVGPWHLKGKQTQHFIFKKNKLKDANHSYKELFVTIIPPGESLLVHRNSSTEQYRIHIYLLGDYTAKETPGIYIGARYKEGSTLEDILESAKASIEGGDSIEQSMSSRILRLTLNLLLYIHSPDPDIMRLKPQVYNSKYFREDYFPKCKNEDSLFGIFSLGWDFHGRQYSIDMGTRRGHFKWQPCGKLWSERKLIFVQATIVNYGKSKI